MIGNLRVVVNSVLGVLPSSLFSLPSLSICNIDTLQIHGRKVSSEGMVPSSQNQLVTATAVLYAALLHISKTLEEPRQIAVNYNDCKSDPIDLIFLLQILFGQK